MKKVKHILATFLHSFIPQDKYYSKLLHTRFQFSLKYYFVIVMCFSCIFTGIIIYQFSPIKMINYKNSIVNSLFAFPDNVTMRIENGVLESNQNKPLFLWMYHNKQPQFVFMVDTKDVLTNSHTPLPLFFLGSDKAQLSYKGSTFIRDYDYSWNVVITKERLLSLIPFVTAFFPIFMIIFYALIIIAMPLLFILCATSIILLASVIAFLVFRSFIPLIHLKKCFQAGMHGTHIPLLIVILLYSLFPSAINNGMIAASLIFIFTLVSTYEMYYKKPGQYKV